MISSTPPLRTDIPEHWHALIFAVLHSIENVDKVLEVDLDEKMNFSPSIVVLTNTRLLHFSRKKVSKSYTNYRIITQHNNNQTLKGS